MQKAKQELGGFQPADNEKALEIPHIDNSGEQSLAESMAPFKDGLMRMLDNLYDQAEKAGIEVTPEMLEEYLAFGDVVALISSPIGTNPLMEKLSNIGMEVHLMRNLLKDIERETGEMFSEQEKERALHNNVKDYDFFEAYRNFQLDLLRKRRAEKQGRTTLRNHIRNIMGASSDKKQAKQNISPIALPPAHPQKSIWRRLFGK